MISNAGDFSELQLVAPDLQREPNEGLCGTKKRVWKTYCIWADTNFGFFIKGVLSRSRFQVASTWLTPCWLSTRSWWDAYLFRRQVVRKRMQQLRSPRGLSACWVLWGIFSATVTWPSGSLKMGGWGTCCVSVRGHVFWLIAMGGFIRGMLFFR